MSDYSTIESDLIVETSLEQLRRFGMDRKVCGNCTHFAKSEGQNRIKEQGFIDQLVREHGWKPEFLGSDLSQLGICGQYESGANTSSGKGSCITGPLHDAQTCSGFKPRNGAIGGGR